MKSIIVEEKIYDPYGSAQNTSRKFIAWQYEGMDRTYGIKIEWIKNDKTTVFQQQIKTICNNDDMGRVYWQIHKQHFFVNEYKPQNPLFLLADKCAALLYPIQFSVNTLGKMHQLNNIDALRKRMQQNKPILLRDYQGPLASDYIHQIENKLQQPQKIVELLEQDIWLQLFFMPITGTYPDGSRGQVVSLPFFAFKPCVSFNGTGIVDDTITPWNTINLSYKGALDLTTLPDSVKYNYQPIEGQITIDYDLDAANHRIQNMSCEVEIKCINGDHYHLKITGYKIQDAEEKKPIQPPVEKPRKWYHIF